MTQEKVLLEDFLSKGFIEIIVETLNFHSFSSLINFLQISKIPERAVNPANDDLDIPSIDGCVNILKSKPELSFEFSKMLVPHLRSPNLRESLLTLEALEELMDAQLSELQVEISKFRFLNELIKLVSLKFEGNKTPKELKDRVR